MLRIAKSQQIEFGVLQGTGRISHFNRNIIRREIVDECHSGERDALSEQQQIRE